MAHLAQTPVATPDAAQPAQLMQPGTASQGGLAEHGTHSSGSEPDPQTPGRHDDDRDAGRPAGTQVDTTARDGSSDAGPLRPADPLTSGRPRLDVSM